MQRFIDWFNSETDDSYIVRSAVAHLWFVSIHPFEDGNGRLARILSDIMLARGDKSRFRFYSISSAINSDKRHYYDILERTQQQDGSDLTEWILWYIDRLNSALDEAEASMNTVLNKSVFWQRNADVTMSERQKATLNKFLDGYESKITSKSWASLGKCSQDTANRDLQDLVNKGVLREDMPGAKRPAYSIAYLDRDITNDFHDVTVSGADGMAYIDGTFRSGQRVRLPIQKLDADRYAKGELPLSNLLDKYCAFLAEG